MEIFNIYTNELNSVTAYHFILRPFESRIALKIIVSLLGKKIHVVHPAHHSYALTVIHNHITLFIM